MSPPIFVDRTKLESSYVPDRLIARDNEVNLVASLFKPLFNCGNPQNAIIYGKTGCGKTACIRFVLREFEQYLNQKSTVRKPFVVMVNCVDVHGSINLLLKIIRFIDPSSMLKVGHSTSVYYDKLFSHLNIAERGLVLILDEIDAIKNPHDLLYMLSRAGEQGRLGEGLYICVIGLTNNFRYLNTQDPRVKSSFGTHWILFPPYNAPDLIAILSDRQTAYTEGVLEEGIIPLCAAIAAKESGDARLAIDLFRTAGDLATVNATPTVTETHVQEARTRLEQEQVQSLIRVLPVNSKNVLKTVLCLNEQQGLDVMTTGELSRAYAKLAKADGFELISHRSITDHIADLAMLGLIETRKKARGRAKGNVCEVSLSLSDTERQAVRDLDL